MSRLPITLRHHQQDPPAYSPPSPWPQQPQYYDVPPPDEPPPSYNDATQSETSPLLVGPPQLSYGTYDPDEASSIASSDMEAEETSTVEYIGQTVVACAFLVILYGFWKIASDPPDFLGGLPP